MRPNYQRGQVYPLFGFMLTVLIGISALSVDIGYYRYQQRVQQAATDSSAIAGAQASFYDAKNNSNYSAAADADATKNGFTNGTDNVTIVVTPNYTDAGNCSSGDCVQVSISKKYPIFFGSIFPHYARSGDKRSIVTYAAARLASVGGACLTSLGVNPLSSTANGAKVDGPNCGIADADCTTVNGGTNVTVQAWTVNAACGASNTWSGGTSQFIPSIPPDDPCSLSAFCQKLATAAAGDLGLTSLTTPSCSSPLSVPASPAGPILHGCYNSPTFKNLTFGSGLYVITGTATFNGTLSANGGVTFYFAQGAQYNDKTNATVTLSAPADGSGDFSAYGAGEEGILMYQTKSGTKWSQSVQANINWTGLVYMPNWDVTFNGHSEQIQGNFVTDSFTINGGSSLTLLPGEGSQGGSPQAVVLAE